MCLLSRPQTRFGEHRLRPAVWRRLCRPDTIDLFATASTAQSRQYVSRVRDPLALGVDALEWKWPAARLYAFPPIPLLLPLVASLHGRLQRGATLVLVTPAWGSAPWFPLLRAQARDRATLPPRSVLGDPSWPWPLWVWTVRA